MVQGTFRLQGGDLKMQVALGLQDTTLKKPKPKQPAEPHPQMFDVRAEFDAVLFKRTMTLNALRALSEGDTIKFPKAALEQIMLRPRGQMNGQWVIWGNQTDFTLYLSHPKTKRMLQMQWRLSCLPSL